jgi:two-component system, OmpR family, sensor histidine kinase KdpD
MSSSLENDGRPDPDALLRKAQKEEASRKRARLRIFFGFAPGVGKTFRMLQVAQELAGEQKIDVVVGIVETHKRQDTEALLKGLEILPRRAVDYRGHTLFEFDLDAALARKPKILLLDELAHTNVPGVRHNKRWQDALDLLDAGIDVYTTLNVQHIESLNDVIAQITRVQVRETIPDSMLDRADELTLVDISPEELLMRLEEGKVYLPDQAQRAAEHFFQRGNLLALRELALRRTAQRVDEDVREYRVQHGVVKTWAASERILVCVGPAPSSGRLIRATRRMAAGLRAEWVAAYVESTMGPSMSETDRERLETHLRLAESLGGTVTRLTGASIAEAILSHAADHNVTRIVIGKPTHSRFRDKIRGSLLDNVVRGSGDVDVHVISGSPTAEEEPQKPTRRKSQNALTLYLSATAIVTGTTGIAVTIRAVYPVPDLEVLYFVAVMVAGVTLGRGPSIFAAAIAVLSYDFFFVPPIYTLSVADVRYFLTFAMMFGVGLFISELISRIRRQEQDARHREQRTAVLYALTRDLADADDDRAIAKIVAHHAEGVFVAPALVLRADEIGELQTLAAWPSSTVLKSKDLGVARWTFEHGKPAGFGTNTLPGSQIVCAPLIVGDATLGVLALEPASPLGAEQRAFMDTLCRQTAFAFERVRLATEARIAALRAKTEETRSSLLSAVSHDLRTPLASITGAATALRDDGGLDTNTRTELLESICHEAERLERFVGNLLDMTRLESGPIILKREWIPLEEMIGSALTRLERYLGERPVNIELPSTLPLMPVDPILFEQVFINLFENASRYTPAASPIDIGACVDENKTFIIEIGDSGSGFTPGTEKRVFEKFYRGEHAGKSGAGLGLPICKAIVEAHGGTIAAENRKNGGALVRITLPLVDVVPSIRPLSFNAEEVRQ